MGYQGTFLVFAVILGITLAYSLVKLPASLNINTSKKPAVVRATARLSQLQKDVTYCMIFRIKRALFCLVTVIFALIFSVFIEPFLTEHLRDIGFSK